MIRTKSSIVIACLLGALALMAGVAGADDKAAAAEKQAKANERFITPLPAAVQTTAREQSKGAVIREVVEEIDAGKKVFEISMRVNGRVRDIIVSLEGEVLVAEEQVDLAALPEAVQATIKKNVGKKKLLIVESVSKSGTFVYYEAQLKSGKQLSEIKVSAEGELLPEDGK